MPANRLDEIYELLVDSQKGYSEAAEIADSPAIARMFAERARERQSMVGRFSQLLPQASLDRNGGTASGGAHRLFLNLRRMVQDDTKVALSEVERGESAFLEAIERALDDNDLVGQERQLVSELHHEVMEDRDAFAGMNERF